MPSLPGGVCSAGSFRTRPTSVIVGLVRSVFTIRRSLFGSVVSLQVGLTAGASIDINRAWAQDGSRTGLVGAEVICSLPPKPLDEDGSPEAEGTSVAVIALS